MIAVFEYVLTTADEMRGEGRKGDRIVSHGVYLETLQNVCLPPENYDSFVRNNCKLINGDWVL